MSKMKVICNTSPIIGLMSIHRLSLLWQLFDEILIPRAVEDELCAKSSEHPQEVEEIKRCIAEGRFMVYQIQNEEIVKKLYGKLHYGELEVIVGAKEFRRTYIFKFWISMVNLIASGNLKNFFIIFISIL